MANADCIIIQGSNMAEAHPVGFQYVVEAKRRGAKIIHVDPRFTRTSALADTYVPLRVGTDIAFLGGIVNHPMPVLIFVIASFIIKVAAGGKRRAELIADEATKRALTRRLGSGVLADAWAIFAMMA